MNGRLSAPRRRIGTSCPLRSNYRSNRSKYIPQLNPETDSTEVQCRLAERNGPTELNHGPQGLVDFCT
jgi:hypothetical protein